MQPLKAIRRVIDVADDRVSMNRARVGVESDVDSVRRVLPPVRCAGPSVAGAASTPARRLEPGRGGNRVRIGPLIHPPKLRILRLVADPRGCTASRQLEHTYPDPSTPESSHGRRSVDFGTEK